MVKTIKELRGAILLCNHRATECQSKIHELEKDIRYEAGVIYGVTMALETIDSEAQP